MGSFRNRTQKIMFLQKYRDSLVSSRESSFGNGSDLNSSQSSVQSQSSNSFNTGYIEVDTSYLLANEDSTFQCKEVEASVKQIAENLPTISAANRRGTENNQKPLHTEKDDSADGKSTFDDSDADPDYLAQPDSQSSENEDFLNVNGTESFPKIRSEVYPKQLSTSDYEEIETRIDIYHRDMLINSLGKSKRHFCHFCGKLQTKFARHLSNKHSKEAEVARFLLLPKKDAARMSMIAEIRKKGDFLYNSQSKHNKGDIIVLRRPRHKTVMQAHSYRPCGHCGNMYSKRSLAVHYRKCRDGTVKGKRDVMASSRLKSYVHPKANVIMKKKILPFMRDDEINYLIRTQETIISFGNRLTYKYRSPHLKKMIRARLRCVAKFFWHFRHHKPEVTNFEDVFDPSMYDHVVKSINDLAGLDERTGRYKAPATASAIASLLKKISLHLIAEMIKQKRKDKVQDIRDFHQLLQEGLSYEVYKTVMENQADQKRMKVIALPSSDDIRKLKKYLDENIEKYKRRIEKKFEFGDWTELASLLLISLQLFNRRRAGEIARIKVEDFLTYESVKDTETKNNLKKYVRFLIRGKKARGVPVMVDVGKLKALNLILKFRGEARVPEKNPYLFGIPGRDEHCHLEADRLLRKYAEACGAEKPTTLRGTELRKHLATNCGIWNLKDVQIKDIADYMGHHEKIHLDHYRLPSATRDITRISNILERAQGNSTDISTDVSGEVSLMVDTSQEIENSDLMTIDDDHSNRDQEVAEFEKLNLTDKKQMNNNRSTCGRLSWKEEEKEVVQKAAAFYIENSEPIPLQLCHQMIRKYKVLKRRSAGTVKAFVMSQIKKHKNRLLSPNKPVCRRGVRKYWTDMEKKVISHNFKENIRKLKLPSLAFCKEVISKNIILKERTAAVVKAYVNNIIKKSK